VRVPTSVAGVLAETGIVMVVYLGEAFATGIVTASR
jgi:hypothetical protein